MQLCKDSPELILCFDSRAHRGGGRSSPQSQKLCLHKFIEVAGLTTLIESNKSNLFLGIHIFYSRSELSAGNVQGS